MPHPVEDSPPACKAVESVYDNIPKETSRRDGPAVALVGGASPGESNDETESSSSEGEVAENADADAERGSNQVGGEPAHGVRGWFSVSSWLGAPTPFNSPEIPGAERCLVSGPERELGMLWI